MKRNLSQAGILIAFTLTLCQCASPHPVGAGNHVGRAVAPSPYAMEPPSTRRVAYLQDDDLRRVRTPEFVKTYHVGRTPESGGRTLHEAHRVYRIEKTSRWNLARENPPLKPVGPVNRTVDVAFRPLPESKALRAELNRQAEITGQLDQARSDAEAALAEIQKRVAEAPSSVATIERLRNELESERQRSQTTPSEAPSNAPITSPTALSPETQRLVDFDKRTVEMEETRKAQRAEPVAEEKPSQP